MGLTIKSIRPADIDGNPIGAIRTDVPEPSAYDYGFSDISGQKAGRLMSSDMFKDMVANARQIDLVWTNVSFGVGSKIKSQFKKDEYVLIEFLDPEGYITRHFYTGDLRSKLYSHVTPSGIVWSEMSVSCIQGETDKR